MSITYGMDQSPGLLYNYDDNVIKPKAPKFTMAGNLNKWMKYFSKLRKLSNYCL